MEKHFRTIGPKKLIELHDEFEEEFVVAAQVWAEQIYITFFLPLGFKKHAQIVYSEKVKQTLTKVGEIEFNKRRKIYPKRLKWLSITGVLVLTALVNASKIPELEWFASLAATIIFTSPALIIFDAFLFFRRREKLRTAILNEINHHSERISRHCAETAYAIFETRWSAAAEERMGRIAQNRETWTENVLKSRTSSSVSHDFFPSPQPQPYGVSHEGAESLCADWMKHFGISDAKVTKFVNDGGIDIQSKGWIAQVKNVGNPVGVASVREFVGVVNDDGRRGLYFSRSGYSSGAIEFADRQNLALLVFHPKTAKLTPANQLGLMFIESSRSRRESSV